MRAYFAEEVRMSRAHHNCLMTKHPRYGSLTGWHRTCAIGRSRVRIWCRYGLALGQEEVLNGALWFVPGSHKMALDARQFDAAKFFRGDATGHAAIIETAISPRLEPGDAVFFHAKTLHSAGRNETTQVKFSLVYTFHAASNAPLPGSRSASKPELTL